MEDKSFRDGYNDAIADVLGIIYGTRKNIMLRDADEYHIGYLKGGVLIILSELMDRIDKLRSKNNEKKE